LEDDAEFPTAEPPRWFEQNTIAYVFYEMELESYDILNVMFLLYFLSF
jgi:hypothetical protein